MANIWEKAISILAVNLNLGRSYLITTVFKLLLHTLADHDADGKKSYKVPHFFSKLFFKRLDLSIARPDSKWRKFENMIPDSKIYKYVFT